MQGISNSTYLSQTCDLRQIYSALHVAHLSMRHHSSSCQIKRLKVISNPYPNWFSPSKYIQSMSISHNFHHNSLLIGSLLLPSVPVPYWNPQSLLNRRGNLLQHESRHAIPLIKLFKGISSKGDAKGTGISKLELQALEKAIGSSNQYPSLIHLFLHWQP